MATQKTVKDLLEDEIKYLYSAISLIDGKFRARYFPEMLALLETNGERKQTASKAVAFGTMKQVEELADISSRSEHLGIPIFEPSTIVLEHIALSRRQTSVRSGQGWR